MEKHKSIQPITRNVLTTLPPGTILYRFVSGKALSYVIVSSNEQECLNKTIRLIPIEDDNDTIREIITFEFLAHGLQYYFYSISEARDYFVARGYRDMEELKIKHKEFCEYNAQLYKTRPYLFTETTA